ncbi:MAG: cytochrome c biogenesis protein ResB [Zetaproteobacteria bacterium]|nr:cytochrome c biogenesis protein ResB [Zetaproteobacteria bacterium]
MPLAIVILSVLALASVIGTVLLQNQSETDYLTQFGPVWYWVFQSLGLFDMYHSWWFLGLLGFLMLSLTLCLWRNVPRMLKEMRAKKVTMADHAWARLPHQDAFVIQSEDLDGSVEKLKKLLPAWSWRTQQDMPGGMVSMRGDKGAYHKAGYILVHSALLVILVGGWMSVQLGFRGNMSVPEGEVGNEITFLKDTDVQRKTMPFSVRCNSFNLEFFSTGAPKEFRSNLTIIDDGKEVLTSDIIVNEPLYYKGVRIYQASFGDGGSSLGLKLFRLDGSQVVDHAAVNVYQTYTDPKTGVSLEIQDFKAYNVQNMANPGEPKKFRDLGPAVDFVLRGPGLKPVKVRSFMNPFMQDDQNQGMFMMISLTGDNKDFEPLFIGPDFSNAKEWALFHAFNRYAQEEAGEKEAYLKAFKRALNEIYGEDRPADMQDMGLRMLQTTQMLADFPWPFIPVLDDYDQVFYTGLQLAEDPGMDVVWLGSAILVGGLCIMLYVSHRRMWVELSLRDGGISVRVAGMANRNPLAFTQAFNQDLMLLKESFAHQTQEKV